MLRSGPRQTGFTLFELIVSMVLIAILLSILVPALQSGRTTSRRDVCADHLRIFYSTCARCLEENGHLPGIEQSATWGWGGVKYSEALRRPYVDFSRPLNAYLPFGDLKTPAEALFCCPSDTGISSPDDTSGSPAPPAHEVYGTSYFANESLFNARALGLTSDMRGLTQAEITTPPSRLILMGDPIWYETYLQSGRRADWHGEPGRGNVLFFNGAVQFTTVTPRGERGAAVVEPDLGSE